MDSRDLVLQKFYDLAVKNITEEVLNDSDEWFDLIHDLPEEPRLTYLIGIFNWQQFNGGLHQYFFNSYGQFAYQTLGALEKIGANSVKSILERALEKVNKENMSEDEFRKIIFNRKLKCIVDFEEETGDYLDCLDDEMDELHDYLLDKLYEYLIN